MLYHPEGIYVWDTWYFTHNDEVHCIHLQIKRPESKRSDSEIGALGHARTKDLVHWEELPTALYSGEEGETDDSEIWTGCVVPANGRYYLYYTARSKKENGYVNRIALATSEDTIKWNKYINNPILIPDGRWYVNEFNKLELRHHGHPIVDCRDLCVVKDPESDGYIGYFAARRRAGTHVETSVIGLCKSKDLIHWEQYPPCFTPDRFGCVEVPDVFCLDGRWYMICLTGNLYGHRGRTSDPLLRHATVYAVADKPEGPYEISDDDNVLIGSVNFQGYSSRTVDFGGERVLFYTQGEAEAGCPHGCISLPSVLRTDSEGHLGAYYHHIMDKNYKPSTPGSPLDVSGGVWGSIGEWEITGCGIRGKCGPDWAVLPFSESHGNCMITCDVTIKDACGAGLTFRMPGKDIMAGGLAVIADPGLNQLQLTSVREFPGIEARTFDFGKNKKFRLRVIMTGNVFMIYIDDKLMIQCFKPFAQSGRIALYVERGEALFENLEVFDEI